MSFRSNKHKGAPAETGKVQTDQSRALQIADRRRQEMATRSTLSRLRNRKSDLK